MTFKKASSFDSGDSTFDISLISLEKRNKERSILLFPQNSSISNSHLKSRVQVFALFRISDFASRES